MFKAIATLCGILSVSAFATQSPSPVRSACADPASGFARGFVGYVRRIVSEPAFAVTRDSLRIKSAAAAEVRYVTDDALCARVGKAVEREFGQPTAARIFVVRAGAVIWAEDSTITAGEFGAGIIFDSTLTKVIAKAFR
jgi:hypothetical protein